MPSMTTSVTCYTDRVMTRFLQAKNAKPKPVKGAPGKNRALARLLGPGSSPGDKPRRGIALRGALGVKKQKRA